MWTTHESHGVRFDERHDVPVLGLALTERAVSLLAAIEADGDELVPTVPADCEHPADEREPVDPDHGIEFCAACRTELVGGRVA